MLEVMPLKQAAGSDEHIDLPTLETGNAQHLGDRSFGETAGTFDAIEPLLGDRGEQPVVVEQCCR